MLHIYIKAFVSILPYIIPSIIVMAVISVWTQRFAKKKQKEAMDSMKQVIDAEVAAQVTDSLKKQ